MLNPTLSQAASHSSSGFSRRDLLKGLTAGLGGVMAAPFLSKPASGAPVTPNLSSSPAILLTGNLASGKQVTATGLASYGPGWIFVLTQSTSGSTTTYDLEFVDAHSLNAVFSFVNFYNRALPSTPFLQPVADDMFVYTANGNNLYCIPLADPMTYAVDITLGGSATGNLVLAGGMLLVTTSDGTLHAYAAKTRVLLWQISVGSSISGVAVSSNTIYVSANGLLGAYSLVDGSSIFSGSVAVGPVTAGGGSVFITSTDGIHSYSMPASGSGWTANWTYSFAGTGTLSATLYNGYLYALDGSGSLHEILIAPSQTPGQANRAPLPLGSDIDHTQPLLFEDGVVYAASAGGTSNLTIYPMVLATGATSAYPTNVAGRFLGVENGTCFFTHNNGGSVAGVALNPQVNGFFAESELMADDYPGGTVKAQGTSFRTHVCLYDANNNPRTNKAVKIWANEPVTLSIDSTIPGGQPTTVALTGGPQSAYWTTTDSAGELSIVCVADNVTCPAIFMWGSFMYQVNGEYMVLYPDQDAVTQLSTKSASDLTSATAYDNSSLLQTQYQGNAADIARHIQNTLTGAASVSLSSLGVALTARPPSTPGHRQPPLLQFDPNKYVAYPGSSPNLASQTNYVQNVAKTYRQFSPSTANYPNGYNVSLSSAGTVQAQLLGIHLGSFTDLIKNVVKGVQKVISVVVSVVNDVVTHVINVAEGFYQFVVNTVEAAAASVAAVLATVANGIKSAYEWLSYLFDWQSFLNTQQQIVTLIQTRMSNYIGWIATIDATTIAQVHTTFTSLEGTITGYIDNFITQLGNDSLQSQQSNNNNPQTAYGAKGAKSYSQSKWMTSKVQNNIGGATTPASAAADSSDPAADIYSAFTELFTSIGNTLAESNFTHIPGDLKKIFDSFQLLWKDPAEFVTKSFAAILGIVRDLVVGFLQLVDAVIENILAVIPKILTAISDMITAEINVPIISELFSAIGAGQLSMLNLVALVAAIPATIIGKVAGVSSAAGAPEPIGRIVLGSIIGFAGLFYSILDSVSDNQNLPNSGPVAYTNMALSAIAFFVATPLDSKPTDIFGYVFYLLQASSLVLSGIAIAVDFKAPKPIAEAFSNVTLPSINSFYGTMMVPFSLGMGLGYPSTFGGLTMISNIFSYIPYIGKQLATGPAFSFPDALQRGVPTVLDALGDTTSAILNIVNAIDG
jgi:phage-related protein